jgi:GTP cyclohydrolase IA
MTQGASAAQGDAAPAGNGRAAGAQPPGGQFGEFDLPRIERAVKEILVAIGEDPERDGLRDTPARVARAYAEQFAGLRQRPHDVLTTVFDADHDEMVIVRDIEVYGTCEHHLVPFIGVAHIGYIPNSKGQITGLSKLARLVDVYARRPQVQERILVGQRPPVAPWETEGKLRYFWPSPPTPSRRWDLCLRLGGYRECRT